ncbi:hypothetical protein DIU36_14825 [Mucilaginibacter rubeus]|nr:hypothetical protein DIU36_14825 [Mucilaginibacter rubeus]
MRYCMPVTYQSVKIPFRPKTTITKANIIDMTSRFYKVSAVNILGDCRKHEYAEARHCAMHLMRLLIPGITLHQIADYFKRDHTTVVYAGNRVHDMLITDGKFRAKYDDTIYNIKKLERATA